MIAGADFSSLEMRLVTLLASDQPYLSCYNSNQDPHKITAAAFFEDLFVTAPPERKARMRDISKSIAYALHYNLSTDVTTVWKAIVVRFPEISLQRVQRFRTFYFKAHPAIREWQMAVVSNAERNKYVEAPLSGRRRYFYDGHVDPNEALNFSVQATAADLTNRAILGIAEELAPNELILAQVHDAIYLEGPDPFRLYGLLKKHMEQVVSLNGHTMKFLVDVGIASNWKDAGLLKVTGIPSCSFQDFLSSLDFCSSARSVAA